MKNGTVLQFPLRLVFIGDPVTGWGGADPAML